MTTGIPCSQGHFTGLTGTGGWHLRALGDFWGFQEGMAPGQRPPRPQRVRSANQRSARRRVDLPCWRSGRLMHVDAARPRPGSRSRSELADLFLALAAANAAAGRAESAAIGAVLSVGRSISLSRYVMSVSDGDSWAAHRRRPMTAGPAGGHARQSPGSDTPQRWPRPISCRSSERAPAAMKVTIPLRACRRRRHFPRQPSEGGSPRN